MPLSPQGSLFESADENPPLREAIDFYQHAHAWSNRLIAGDSLLVMNSLLDKEVKGQDSPQNQAKRAALHEWAHAATEHGGFGKWTWGVSKSPSDIQDVVAAGIRA